jgi:hypothetical protein
MAYSTSKHVSNIHMDKKLGMCFIIAITQKRERKKNVAGFCTSPSSDHSDHPDLLCV